MSRNRGPRFGGPKLPAALLDEVETKYGEEPFVFGLTEGKARGPSRKEQRKAARKGPPPRQRGEASGSGSSRREERPAVKPVKRAASPEPEPERKRAKVEAPSSKNKSKKEERKTEEGGKKKQKKELVLPQDDGDVEDREIAWLEYMLKKESGDDSDGLDDILDFTERMESGNLNRGDLSDSDEEMEGMGFTDFGVSDDEVDLSEGGEDDDGDDDDDDDEEEDESEDEMGDGDEEDAEDADGADSGSDEPPTAAAEPATAAPEAPTETTRYIPPHLRAAMLAEKAAGDSGKVLERGKLERKAQGLLNKLSEANLDSILAEVEKLFGEYSRNDVTTTLTSQVIAMIGSRTNLLDSFVVLYATLVGALHRVIGLEFGAHFVQTLVKRYHSLATELTADPEPQTTEDDEVDTHKEVFNLLTLIAELYNAGVIGAGLIYDLVRGFIGDGDELLNERNVEGLMKILKCCGSQLRADDPASLKDIVALVQERTRGRDKEMTTRARFMVETLVALQSGKKKGLGAEREDVARMRRFLGGLGKKRRLLAPEPLRVGLADLLSADARGKWWLVGAGWSGNPLVEKAGALSASAKKKVKTVDEQEDEEVILDFARKQGMNTDVRRSVFVTLLTSEDFQHAVDRLHALKLTHVQQREFVRVTLHCCGMEGAYNPYYTLVLNLLCANSYDHRFTLQYAVWDLLRELDDGGVTDERAGNVARTLAFLFARGSVDMTILKVLDFTDMSKATRRFLDTLLRTLLVSAQSTSPLLRLPKGFTIAYMDAEAVEAPFEKALAAPELAGGLAWAIQGIKRTPAKGTTELAGEVVRLGAEAALGVLARAI